MTTESDHHRVLKAAGFRPINASETHWFTPESKYEGPIDLTQDDLAAKYLLPVIYAACKDKVIDIETRNGPTFVFCYEAFSNCEHGHCHAKGETFGQALHAFTIALLDAGIIE